MTSDSFDTDPHDPTESPQEAPGSPDSPDAPLTATGERSATIEEDEDGGVLPIAEPTADGAPAP